MPWPLASNPGEAVRDGEAGDVEAAKAAEIGAAVVVASVTAEVTNNRISNSFCRSSSIPSIVHRDISNSSSHHYNSISISGIINLHNTQEDGNTTGLL